MRRRTIARLTGSVSVSSSRLNLSMLACAILCKEASAPTQSGEVAQACTLRLSNQMCDIRHTRRMVRSSRSLAWLLCAYFRAGSKQVEIMGDPQHDFPRVAIFDLAG